MTRTRYVALASRSGNPLRRKVLYRRGQLVVHWSMNTPGSYAISHALTGYGVPFAFQTLSQARAIVRQIDALGCDWRFTDVCLVNPLTAQIMREWANNMRANPPKGTVIE